MGRLVCGYTRQTKTFLVPVKPSIAFMVPNTPYTFHYTCANSFRKSWWVISFFLRLLFALQLWKCLLVYLLVCLLIQRPRQHQVHFPHTSSSWAWGSCSAWGEGECQPPQPLCPRQVCPGQAGCPMFASLWLLEKQGASLTVLWWSNCANNFKDPGFECFPSKLVLSTSLFPPWRNFHL